MRVRSLVVLVGALLGILAGASASAQVRPGFVSTPVFGSGGLAMSVFTGGSVADLEAAARAAGASGVWAQDATGNVNLLVVGGPAFLTDPFRAAIPTGFAGATAVTLTRGSGEPPAPPAAPATPPSPTSPPPAVTPPTTPTTPAITYPQPGAPSPLLTITGDLRPDNDRRFAYDVTRLDTGQAAALGLPVEMRQVTYVRVCRWSGAVPSLCTDEVAPDADRARSRTGVTYYIELPAPGRSTTVSLQLCNGAGCAAYLFIGTTMMEDAGRFYAVAAVNEAATRVRPYTLTADVKRTEVEYSDGMLSAVVCERVGVCASGLLDSSVARTATVRATQIDGSVMASESIVLRGTTAEVTGQRLQPPAPAGRAPRVDPGVAFVRTTSEGGLSLRVGGLAQLSVVSPNQPTEFVTASSRGASLTHTLPGGGLTAGTVMTVGLVADLDGLSVAAPPPTGTDLLFGWQMSVVPIGGSSAVVLPKQARVRLVLPAALVPSGTAPTDVSVVHWDGARWIVLSDATSLAADGSLQAQVWTVNPGVYGLLRRMAR